MPVLKIKKSNMILGGEVSYSVETLGDEAKIYYDGKAKVRVGPFTKDVKESGNYKAPKKLVESETYKNVGFEGTLEDVTFKVIAYNPAANQSTVVGKSSKVDGEATVIVDVSKELADVVSFDGKGTIMGLKLHVIALADS